MYSKKRGFDSKCRKTFAFSLSLVDEQTPHFERESVSLLVEHLRSSWSRSE